MLDISVCKKGRRRIDVCSGVDCIVRSTDDGDGALFEEAAPEHTAYTGAESNSSAQKR